MSEFRNALLSQNDEGESLYIHNTMTLTGVALDVTMTGARGAITSSALGTTLSAIAHTTDGDFDGKDRAQLAGSTLGAAIGGTLGNIPGAILGGFLGEQIFEAAHTLFENLEFDPTFDPINELSTEIHDVLPNIPLESLRAQLTELALAHQARGGATGTPFFEDPVDALFETAEGRALLAKWEMDNQLAGMVQPTPQASYTNPRYVELRNPYSLEGPEATAGNYVGVKEDDSDDLPLNAPDGTSALPKEGGSNPSGGSGVPSKPIILDLDGLGISVTELSQSTVFVDGGDGLEHRTAWAGAGDGVLFFDADGSGDISEQREYVFTEWDPTATSDLEALRSVFDTNGDGVLNASDTTWSQFRVARTEPDGTLSFHTLDALGITEIDLMGDATNIELPDGSVITGQTTFTMNGQTRTVGEMVLATDGRGYRLKETESTSGGVTTRDIEAYGTGGELAWAIHVVAATDGSSTVNSYDDDGDGIVDRVQECLLRGTPLELQYAMTKGGAGYARVC